MNDYSNKHCLVLKRLIALIIVMILSVGLTGGYVYSDENVYSLANECDDVYAAIGEKVELCVGVKNGYHYVNAQNSKFSFRWYKYKADNETLLSTSRVYTINSIAASDYSYKSVDEYGDSYDDNTYICKFYVNGNYQSEAEFIIKRKSIYAGETKIVNEGIVKNNMPNGVSYDASSDMVTLTNYSGAGIWSDGNLNVKLNGNNTTNIGDISEGESVKIIGDGTLNSEHGIWASKKLEIKDATININSGDSYGMSLNFSSNYCLGASDCHIKIENSKMNIKKSFKANSDDNNVGIDAQDGDLIIKNSEVNTVLTNGLPMGYVAGWYDGNQYFGGKMSIDNKSIVKLTTNNPEAEDDDILAMYYYEDDINSPYIYSGQKSPGALTTKAKAFNKEGYGCDDYDNPIFYRFECYSSFLELTPNYRESEVQTTENNQPTSNNNQTTTKKRNSVSNSSYGQNSSSGKKKKVKKPKRVVIKKAYNDKKRRICLIWKGRDTDNGYQIKYTYNKKTKKITVGRYFYDEQVYIIKNLKKNKKYSIRIRAFIKKSGKKVYGKWSKVKKVKVRK